MITVEINDSKGQKYTKKWESMPEFEDWILPDKSNVHRAWCKYCNKSMKAKCSSLKYHANSTVHLKAVGNLVFYKKFSVKKKFCVYYF